MGQMVMTGCLNVDFKRIGKEGELTVENKNTAVRADYSCLNHINVLWRNENSIDLVVLPKNKEVSISKERKGNRMNVSFGIVCTVGTAIKVLFASDGALLTIDGMYLVTR